MPSDNDDNDIRAAELRVAEVIGGLMEFWGFKAVMGRLWTILYLSPEPLPAAELGERLQASAGAVSMALNDLQKWGVVKKAWRPGERRDFYEPETSIWKMVTRVFRERELATVRAAIEAFESARKLLAKARADADSEHKKRIKFIDGRLASLLTLSRIGEGLILMLTSGQPVNPQPIKSLFHPEDET
jgi:DNA-binding transcriptional regulator GbsR (MarR family)